MPTNVLGWSRTLLERGVSFLRNALKYPSHTTVSGAKSPAWFCRCVVVVSTATRTPATVSALAPTRPSRRVSHRGLAATTPAAPWRLRADASRIARCGRSVRRRRLLSSNGYPTSASPSLCTWRNRTPSARRYRLRSAPTRAPSFQVAARLQESPTAHGLGEVAPRSNTRRFSLPSAYAKDAPATPAPTTITSHCRAAAKRINGLRVTNTVSVVLGTRRSSTRRRSSRASNRSRDGNFDDSPSRVRDVTAAATRARRRRSSQPRRISGVADRETALSGAKRVRGRSETHSDAAPADAVASPPGPSSRVRVPRVTRSANDRAMRLSNDDRRRRAGLTRDDTRRACGCSDALVGTRRALRVRRRRARATSGGATVQATSVSFTRGRKPRFGSRLLVSNALPSYAESRLGPSHPVAPTFASRLASLVPRVSSARSASIADARSTRRATRARTRVRPRGSRRPGHGCVLPSGALSSETAATASGPPPA